MTCLEHNKHHCLRKFQGGNGRCLNITWDIWKGFSESTNASQPCRAWCWLGMLIQDSEFRTAFAAVKRPQTRFGMDVILECADLSALLVSGGLAPLPRTRRRIQGCDRSQPTQSADRSAHSKIISFQASLSKRHSFPAADETLRAALSFRCAYYRRCL